MPRHPRSPHGPILAVVSVLAALAAPAALSAAIPPPAGYISDFAGLLPESNRSELHALVKDVREQTSVEITVVTVDSLDGMEIDDYAVQLFKQWGIGKKGTDTGVLLLVAKGDRKVRIEVGYGLEPILPDALTSSILRTDVTPAFKEGEYVRGITAGVRRIADVVKAKHVLTQEERASLAGDAGDPASAWVTTPLLGLFVAIGAFVFGSGFRSKSVTSILLGAVFVCILLLLGFALDAAMWVLAPLAGVMTVVGIAKGKSSGSGGWSMSAAAATDASSSSWSSSSPDSSTDSSSSDSSSDSFGGGESGGGGSSDSW